MIRPGAAGRRQRAASTGRVITGWRPDRITGAGLVRTFQIARGFPRLSVLDNLLLYGTGNSPANAWCMPCCVRRHARRREAELRERAVPLRERLNLARVLDHRAGDLSGGQKKLLEIGRALMAEPKLLLLDEPVAGVNPTLAREIGEHLRGLLAEGISVLLIEHHMDTIAALCDPVIVMAEGRHLRQGTFAELADDPVVQEAYMGRRR